MKTKAWQVCLHIIYVNTYYNIFFYCDIWLDPGFVVNYLCVKDLDLVKKLLNTLVSMSNGNVTYPL